MSSNAVTLDRISRIVGYKLTKGSFNFDSPNLPQRIAVLAEANDANQASLLTTPQQITTAQQAATLFGDGSPAHLIARILFPFGGDGVGGIPVFVYPQTKAVGATPKVIKVTATGVATGNATHYVKLAGREGIDGTFYGVSIATGDNSALIAQKISDAVNKVFGSPMTGYSDTYEALLQSNWSGLTANDLNVQMDTNGAAVGITYTVTTIQTGAGTPSIANALAQFGTDWNTIVLNSYSLETTTVIQALMAFNGIPDPLSPTGRYSGIIMKPFIAITGSIADDPSSITDLYKTDVTIAVAPAPGSLALPMEAAANAALLFALQAQNSPHLDIAEQAYPDMPVSSTWPSASMSVYNTRDAIVKKGCSTVNVVSGNYVMQDFVTTYHPDGEVPPQFRYCRNLNIDYNIRYAYYLLEQSYVVGHAIAADDDVVTADTVVKPKTWKARVDELADDLSKRALTVQPSFMQDSITVNIGTSNPDRLETFFRYKRSGFARISSTTGEAGFNFGTL